MNVKFRTFVNKVPLCQLSVTVSLKCHLNQLSTNGYPNMSMDNIFANAMSFEPLLCHFNHWDATQGESHFMGPSLYSTASAQGLAPRLFPSIEGNDRGPCLSVEAVLYRLGPMKCFSP